ncbi:ABC transporter [Photobacterium sanguinicancri]|uniref:ABC transporter n=1 Tax=Photobacterium sanguinicancri TaxID=875932 RepID=UPI0026E3E806|nr:ABC transporter [Photobacterium sanguinicancri]MDO6496682.1 ABC transporter [Photobacterium sanguinicancri]
MNRLLCLVNKELIEYPFILRFPIVIACMLLLALALFMSGNDVSVTWQVNGSSIIPDVGDFLGFAGVLGNFNVWVASIVAAILFLVYAPKALRKEREEGSLMFWRSMPVSDWEAVLVKLLFALVVLPVIASTVLAFSDFIVWLLSLLWTPQTLDTTSSITLWALLLHWLTFIGRMVAVSIALVPFVSVIFLLSQITRAPLIVLLVAIFLLNITTSLALGTTALGDSIKGLYHLPITILFSDNPIGTLFSVSAISWLGLMIVSAVCLALTVKMRQTDDFLARFGLGL